MMEFDKKSSSLGTGKAFGNFELVTLKQHFP